MITDKQIEDAINILKYDWEKFKDRKFIQVYCEGLAWEIKKEERDKAEKEQ